MTISTIRHDAYFDYTAFTEQVHVVGVGGVGSHVAMQLAKLGTGKCNEVHFWDGDVIDAVNPANQAYFPGDVNRRKVDVLSENFAYWSGYHGVLAHPEFVKEKVPFSGVVFLCLDSMRARKEICEASLWGNKDVSLVIETRMDASHVVVYTFDPNNEEHVETWKTYWFPDDEAENELGCGGHISIISTVLTTASFAVQQFIAYASSRPKEERPNRVHLNLRSWEGGAEWW